MEEAEAGVASGVASEVVVEATETKVKMRVVQGGVVVIVEVVEAQGVVAREEG